VELLLGTNIASIADAGGLPEVRFREEQVPPRQFDIVLYALGGSTPENFLKTIGIEFNGASPHLQEGYETSVPGMFLVGDLSAGPRGGSIIWAFNSANTAIRKICRDHLRAAGSA
jgi:thioredoxin reductase (NADPH)